MKLKRTAAALTAAAMLPLCACQSAPPQVQLDPSSPTAIEICTIITARRRKPLTPW